MFSCNFCIIEEKRIECEIPFHYFVFFSRLNSIACVCDLLWSSMRGRFWLSCSLKFLVYCMHFCFLFMCSLIELWSSKLNLCICNLIRSAVCMSHVNLHLGFFFPLQILLHCLSTICLLYSWGSLFCRTSAIITLE